MAQRRRLELLLGSEHLKFYLVVARSCSRLSNSTYSQILICRGISPNVLRVDRILKGAVAVRRSVVQEFCQPWTTHLKISL